MKYLKSLILIVLTGIFCYSCSTDSDDQEDLSTDDINIYFGSFGGLCGYSDSLSIFSNLDTHFDVKNICTDTDFETEKNLSQSEYNDLVNSFSIADFKALSFNSCARCVDGIDHFLHIVGSDFRHRIVYSDDDNIKAIQDLLTELESIRELHQPE